MGMTYIGSTYMGSICIGTIYRGALGQVGSEWLARLAGVCASEYGFVLES